MPKTFAVWVLASLLAACAASPISPTSTAVPPAPPANPPTVTLATPTPVTAAEPIVINSPNDLQLITKEIASAESATAQAHADELWQTLVKEQRVPLIFGNQVIFFYKGQADQVNWRGSFNSWAAPGVAGQRLGQTDLWIGTQDFPSASRAEYKIVVNDKDWVLDAANPNTTFSGLTGANNVFTMPGFSVTDESRKRNDVTPGTLTGGLSITSRYLGYAVNYWVYTPVGYENLKQLPVFYVLDGNDFVDERMGALPNVLDNLIAGGRIHPVLVVFVDARDPNNQQFNRREEEFLVHPIEHGQFIVDELVPAIDQAYRTDPRPDARVITGVSYGGLSAAYIGTSQSTVFHNIAAFSPSFWVLDSPQYLTKPEQVDGSKLMLPAVQAATQCGGDTGFACPRLPLNIFVTVGLTNWDVGNFANLVDTLQQQGYPVEFHQAREGHTWDHWRGLSDEMLINFVGTD